MNQSTPTVRQMFALINDGLNCDHASATFCMNDNGGWEIVKRPYMSFCETSRKYYCVPALTLDDMLNMLPQSIGKYILSVHSTETNECVQYEDPETKTGKLYVYEPTRIDAVYRALSILMADGVINTTKTFNYDERIIPCKRSVAR